MTAVWITIAALAAGTIAAKTLGPLATGHRELNPRGLAVTRLVAPAILAGLVVYETFSAPGGLAVDARLAGLAAAVAALIARLPMIVVIVLAAAVTAGVRAVT
jgi:hypothetical protein